MLSETPGNNAYIHSLVAIYGVTSQQATNDLIDAVDRIAAEPDPNAEYNAMLIAQKQEEFAQTGD